MNFFELHSTDKVLLLGEGNFSFSSNLAELVSERSTNSAAASIVATCFESQSEQFSEEKKRNIDYLLSKGVTVLFGVDVNNLEQHFIKGTDVFSKVIFNFPHVGGKMKIHLNRSLLQHIFMNVKDFISDDSKVCITLCDGQGGTEADSKLRRYDDSWQVVEMAAISNFTLKYLEPFPVELFPHYSAVGYRSLDKGFHVRNSLAHIFQLGKPLSTALSDSDLLNLFSSGQIQTIYGPVVCPKIHAFLHSLNLFTKPNSLFNFILQKLEHMLKKHLKDSLFFMPDDVLPIHKEFTQGTASFFNGRKVKLRSSLYESLKSAQNLPAFNFSRTLTIFKGHCFKDLNQSFELSPIEGQLLLLGCDCFNFTIEFLELLKRQYDFNFEIRNDGQNSRKIFISDESSSVEVLCVQFFLASYGDKDSVPSCTIFCDPLVKIIFKIKYWQELWSEDTIVEPRTSSVLLPSLYPLTFKFDVNFLVEPNFDISNFFELIWSLMHIAVVNTELVREYIPPEDTSKRYLCFRVYYKSFKHPLCRGAALSFHRNVLSRAITLVLNAPIC